MQFIGLRKDKDTGEIIKYELKLYRQDVSCLYKDRYGVYICTKDSRMYKVEHTMEELRDEIGL